MQTHTLARAAVAALLVLTLPFTAAAAQPASSPAEVWRDFARRLEPGASILVRTASGQRVKAALLQVTDDAITIQPKTRRSVPPQRVAFADIQSLEVQRNGGLGVGKAVALGAAVGAGAFFALLALAVAAFD